ncbi:hypothetical protein GOBAR_AA07936 [Gossypium barbadense]|uniref:Uncharacterized protein n=1 Tax=Gossypium barbadense TaxID=3634 RepID=A0A2P5YAV9_GOSBA|nr:hypothetical protein GOBAR_AA07936 [Gossypium barbadense]
MGNSIAHKTRYALTFLCFILLVLFTLFLFTKRTLEPYLSFYQPSFHIHSSNAAFIDGNQTLDTAHENREMCDLYTGTWVKDDDYPIYKPGSCPYVDEAFDCQSNGRPDSNYLRWRWKPDGCDLPRVVSLYCVRAGTAGVRDAYYHSDFWSVEYRQEFQYFKAYMLMARIRSKFNATDFLERLRGKRLMLVGDSMNRNQFESILCLLREGLTNKSKMYEVYGYKITKERGYFIFKFEDYNCTVVFVRSHFLVKEGIRINEQGNSNPTLSIDKIDKTSDRWKQADILIFNTAHWWVHGKTARGYIIDLTMNHWFSPSVRNYKFASIDLFTSIGALQILQCIDHESLVEFYEAGRLQPLVSSRGS